MKQYKHIDAGTKVIDVVNHPAFEGFGHLLFPLEDKVPDPDMKLDGINPLLYHYINIDVNTTVKVINYMLDEVSAGRTIFYGIHSEQDKGNFPKTKDTGLFYFRGKPGAPFAIVCPGGAFKYLGSIHESFPIALELSRRGYNAFSLQYRTGGAAIACEDLACAMTTVFDHAKILDINTEGYSLWGSSAGARMVAYLGSYGAAPYGGRKLPKPAAIIMQYTSHADYTEQDPPAFAVIGEDDNIASCDVMEARINALKAAGIDTEFHKYPNLAHGFALGTGTAAEGWLDDAVRFWEKQVDHMG